jgi:hypothetical protein
MHRKRAIQKMALRSAKYVNNPPEAHVKESNREHDRNHGNQPTGRLRTSTTHPPGDEVAHTGTAGVGGVIGLKTRDTDYTSQIHRRLTQCGTA